MAILIGITAGEIYNKADPWAPVTYGQTKAYVEAVIAAGGTPLILPMTTDTHALKAMYDSVDGLLFAGGNDVSPKLYHQEPYATTKDASELRDDYESQLLTWALADQKPVLAICRGMQLLNVLGGGNLYQDINVDLSGAEDHGKSTSLKDTEHLAHVLRIKPGSKLADILGVTEIKTNTHHHQAIQLLAPSLEAVAWAEDGIIEAVEGKDGGYVVGVQSHPESLVQFAEKTWLNLFSSLVRAAAKKAKLEPAM